MEPKHKGFFGFNLLRLGEGLVVGVGVAIVLALFNTMTNATEKMNKTRICSKNRLKLIKSLKIKLS